jgi:hypothetical protein
MGVPKKQKMLWKGNDRRYLRKLQTAVYEMRARDARLILQNAEIANPDSEFTTLGKGGTDEAMSVVTDRITYLLASLTPI